MGKLTTRQHIIDTARGLFVERGFTATTIRDIAETAGVSPALVIKLTGPKAQLFKLAAPDIPDDEGPLHHDEPVGYRLVRNVVERRDTDDFDYWATAPFVIQEAPDRELARDEMRGLTMTRIAAAIGDDSVGKVPTRLVNTLLLGLACSLRTIELIPTSVLASEELIETYGAIVQSIIDDQVKG